MSESDVLRSGLFSGYIGVVTGAGSGIGRAIALRLVSLGMDVTGIGRKPETLAETGKLASGLDGTFDFESGSVRDVEFMQGALAKIGDAKGIDLLVNNAGGQFSAPAEAITRKGWDAVLDLNLSAVFSAITAAYPYLRRRKGAVVNISLSGVERGSAGIAHSIAARAGVLGLTRTFALEWAKTGVRLNCIGPGTVVTEALAAKTGSDAIARLTKAIPMGRATSPEEVAELVAFLASPAAKLMSGQLIQIDGVAHLGDTIRLTEAA